MVDYEIIDNHDWNYDFNDGSASNAEHREFKSPPGRNPIFILVIFIFPIVSLFGTNIDWSSLVEVVNLQNYTCQCNCQFLVLNRQLRFLIEKNIGLEKKLM